MMTEIMVDNLKVKVTIGLCTRNSEKTVYDAVYSIANQNFDSQQMEIIVVDGQSQDRTLSIIKDCLSKKSLNVTYLSDNVGLGFARQLVVQHAKGDYILWVDGDIILSKDYIKTQVDFMDQHPLVGVAQGSFGLLPDDNWVATLENIGHVLVNLSWKGKPTLRLLGTEAGIFRLVAIQQVGGFNRNIKGACEDMDLAMRLREHGWVSFLTSPVFYERQRSTWKGIWKQYYWYGYGTHFFKSYHRKLRMDLSSDRRFISFLAYRMTHRKTIFLLPLHFIFKKSALLAGFFFAHLDGYGHDSSHN
jgi:glycosyltransferase involved in cell wall biosynthesis